MTLGVNYRLGLNPASGIPLTIHYLYAQFEKNPQLKVLRFIPPKFIPSLVFDFFYCAWLLKKHPVDVFHGPSFILPIWKPKQTRFVVTIHDLAFIARPEVATWRFRVLYRFLTAHSLRIADRIVAVSESTKSDIIKYFSIPTDKITVIPNGISSVYLKNQPQKKLFDFDYLLTVSTHPYRKNTFMLVEAFKELNYPGKLIIAGNLGDYGKNALLGKINELGLKDRIVLTGRVSEAELSSLYQHSDLFIYPSTYEGFGMPLLEAMASRCLVLGANTSCIPEVVPDKRCLFFPVYAGQITGAIQRLLSLSQKTKSKLINNHQHFAHRFSWEAATLSYKSLFKSLVS